MFVRTGQWYCAFLLRVLSSYFADSARQAVLESKGIEKIVTILESLQKDFDPSKDNKIEMTACGAVLNTSTDCGKKNVLNLFSDNSKLLLTPKQFL